MKKILAAMMALVMCAMMIGCGAGAKDEEKSLRVGCLKDSAEDWNEVIARYNEKNPDVKIEVSAFDDYTALNQNVMSAHAAGQDYDIVTINHVDTLAFIKGELLYPIGDKGINVDDQILGSLENMGKLGDKLYAVPLNTDTRIMAVNTDLLDKYGLETPTTLDEMLSAGKIITDAGQGDYIFNDEMCTNGDYFSTYETGIFLQSIGGQLYTVDENGIAHATVDTPEMREYLTFITELIPYMPADCTTNNNARNAWLEGNVAMYTFGPWEYGQFNVEDIPFNWELVKVPAGKAGSVSTSGGYQMGIGSGTKNIDLALDFFNFVINDGESMYILGGTGLPTSVAASEMGDFGGERYKVFMEQLESSNLPQVPVANLGEVVACFTGYWNDLCVGNITVDDMIKGAQTDVQALLDESNS